MKDFPILRGKRRELTRELFEELGALQCEPQEILGFVGTTPEKLERWCRRTYRMPLEDILRMVRQDGLIEIRRAGFDTLRRSAPLIQQQFSRYLPPPPPDREQEMDAARQVFSLLRPQASEMEELFSHEL